MEIEEAALGLELVDTTDSVGELAPDSWAKLSLSATVSPSVKLQKTKQIPIYILIWKNMFLDTNNKQFFMYTSYACMEKMSFGALGVIAWFINILLKPSNLIKQKIKSSLNPKTSGLGNRCWVPYCSL